MKILKVENKVGRVRLDDQVDEWSRKQLAEELKRVFGKAALSNPEFQALTASAANEVDVLEIEINSPGGSVLDGMLIYNELRSMRARGVRVVAIVNVLAASMGSVIAMAADEVQIVRNGQMMIHDASIMGWGNSDELKKMADLVDSMSAEIAAIYSEKTGMSVADCRALMKEETWMNSAKCIELGFADSIFDISPKPNNLTNMTLIDRLTNSSAPEALDKIKSLEGSISSLEAELVQAAEAINTLKDSEAAAIARLAEETRLRAKAEAESEELAKKIEQAENLVEELKQEVEKAKEEANADASAKAVSMLAAVGHDPVEETGTQSAVASNPIVEKLNSLKGKERQEFYHKNKAQIFNALRKA